MATVFAIVGLTHAEVRKRAADLQTLFAHHDAPKGEMLTLLLYDTANANKVYGKDLIAEHMVRVVSIESTERQPTLAALVTKAREVIGETDLQVDVALSDWSSPAFHVEMRRPRPSAWRGFAWHRRNSKRCEPHFLCGRACPSHRPGNKSVVDKVALADGLEMPILGSRDGIDGRQLRRVLG